MYMKVAIVTYQIMHIKNLYSQIKICYLKITAIILLLIWIIDNIMTQISIETHKVRLLRDYFKHLKN